MRFPSLSNLEPEQLQAIGEAKEKGSGLFRSKEITYTIFQSDKGFIVSAMNHEGEDVGYINSSPYGQHYAIEVPPEFRGQGIGTILLRTKEAMDGVLSHDWSGRYSRIFFLIKKGYFPDKKVYEYGKIQQDEVISPEELTTLIDKLQLHVNDNLSGDSLEDVSPIIFRLKYSPGRARKFIQEHNLG